jgi:stearoyl-CoA desaturase (delta-9 desaturase)
MTASSRSQPLVPPEEGRVELGLAKTAWLYALLGGTALLLLRPPSRELLHVAAALAAVTLCAGHSVGLHRGIIHRAYRSSRFVRGLLAYLFVHTGIGGPVSWLRLHYVRDYYQNAASCPRYFGYAHSLVRDFVWNLQLRFVPRDPKKYGVPDDDETDPWLVFLERTWPLHVLGLFAFVAALFGLTAALTIVCLRVAVSVVGHWFVGFMAHKYGYVRYELPGSPEIGRNLLVLGAISFGEGFHNNHHANPGSARMGEAWFELDLGWLLVRALERLGIVWDVQATGRSGRVERANARRIDPVWKGRLAPRASR